MKLRNKSEYIGEEKPKGRVGTLIGYSDSHKAIVVEFEGEDGGTITSLYRSLAELNEDWEDYKPKEPLIKDEKIRKAVRSWAEANRDIREITYEKNVQKAFCDFVDLESMARLRFNFIVPLLKCYEVYTIAELCGEEE